MKNGDTLGNGVTIKNDAGCWFDIYFGKNKYRSLQSQTRSRYWTNNTGKILYVSEVGKSAPASGYIKLQYIASPVVEIEGGGWQYGCPKEPVVYTDQDKNRTFTEGLSFRYEGINGTRYSSTEKPTKVGTYRLTVNVTMNDETNSEYTSNFGSSTCYVDFEITEDAPLSYIDAEGIEQTTNHYLELTNDGTPDDDGFVEFGEGTYVVKQDLNITHGIRFTRNTDIILCDGCTLSI